MHSSNSDSNRPIAGGLQRKFLRSHFTIAAIGVVLLVVALGAMLVLRTDAVRLAQLRGPTARTSMLALSGTNRSLAALRGWMVLGEPRFLDDFGNAWKQDIRPAVAELDALSHNWTNPENNQRLRELKTTLDELETFQREVAAVAQSPANQPAQLLMDTKIRPVADTIIADVTALIDAEKQTAGSKERKRLLGSLADFRAAFTLCQVRLGNVISTGSDRDEQSCCDQFDLARAQLEKMVEQQNLLTDAQREQLLRIQKNSKQYETLREQALGIRKSDNWNVARHFLATHCIPRASRATQLLTAMSTNQSVLMREDADRVGLVSNLAIAGCIGLVLAMAVTARLIAVRSARQMAQPITTLALATHELATGRLNEDIPVPDDSELGQLTQSFNNMRHKLHESEQRFARAIDDAPFPIMIHSEDGVVHKTNKVWTELTGYEPSELPTLTAWTERAYGQKMDLVRSRIDELYALDGRVHEGEYEPTTKSGDKRVWDFSTAPLGTTPDGKRLVVSMAMDVTARKHAEDALRRSEANLTDFFENASVGLHWVGPDGIIQRVNRAELKLLGYEKEEYVGRHIAEFHVDQDVIDDILTRLGGHETLRDFEARLRCKDGTIKTVLITSNVLWQDGKFIHTRCFTHDITDRKRAQEELKEAHDHLERRVEERTVELSQVNDKLKIVIEQHKQTEQALRESEDRLHGILESTVDGIITIDEQGLIESTNPAVERLFGWSAAELCGRNVKCLMPEPYALEHDQFLGKYLATGEKNIIGIGREVRGKRKDGTTFPMDLSVNEVLRGKRQTFVGVVRDITERKQAESALKASHKRLQATLDGMYAFVGLYSPDGTLIEANRAPLEAAGLKREDVIGKLFWDTYWWSYSPEVQAQLKAAFDQVARGETVRYDVPVRVGEGQFITIDVMFSPLYDDDGNIIQFVGSAVDITERKQIEKQREALIEQLERKNAELERFAYTVSHDLKGPLITIKGFLGLLEQDLSATTNGDSERYTPHMTRIGDAADRMTQLLDELLELSRIGHIASPSEPVALNEVAKQAVKLCQTEFDGTAGVIEFINELPTVLGDRSRLQEVLQNLIENAVRFTRDQPEPRIVIGARQDGNETVCYVRDNGAGIEPQYHEKIFGLFEQLDPQRGGTGIGLAIVKRIIEVHGGRIWVESEGANKGSTFCFTVPESSQPALST